ncbi:aminopeptidase P family protein [Lysinibacillus sphaericus]|uniref:Peptidase M24 n=3 Tax=Lysinibacillus TaxID=400634 RepID=A0A2S0JZ23_LYSSH|nr:MULTISPECIES: Xaa-Pro peptidase family protein [Lysinibacillus]AHN22372.1 peptidase M24 [Lysinibacillus varians]AVK96385.1 Xaa-Pro dipeptidase [Lysinibacillus sphaericus]MED4545434.1 Xaa-Pro peptidase family protein [Lysinibacillus sphaericus]TKI19628.1 aminopeptidase P family protein [Lysinibacillus sphaericus]TKI50252.1 aminopeptidase P family protein [Lysinibacillus tabacifolii]
MLKLQKLRKILQEQNIDGILITNEYNRRYMTGFTGTAGVAIVSQNDAVFITDFRYTEQATAQIKDYRIVQHEATLLEEIATQVKAMGIKLLGFEKDSVSYGTYELYKNVIQADLVPVSGLIEKIRLIKTAQEINIIKVACEIADHAFTHILDYIKPGKTELDVSNELEFFMRQQGATQSSFDTIVASGLRSALPHGVATNKVIEKGDFVTLDFGALYNGYISDITRTVAVGEPSEKLVEMYNTVLASQLLALEKVGPGLTGIQADAIARDYLTEKGYGEAFGHSLGHGIGLEVHEGPGLSKRSNTVLEPGMAVTIEPGVYVPGVGGVRIEDDILITESGNELLTHSTKELIIL